MRDEHETDDDALTPAGDGVWLATTPVRILGMGLSSTMVALRLRGDSLLLYSPVGLTPARRAAVEALGEVAHLYAPNLYHHLWLGEWAEAFPGARVHAPAGLRKKRPDLRVDRTHGAPPEPDFEGLVDELPIAGFRLEEAALYYHPARALVVADLVHNIGAPEGAWTRLYTKAMGFYDQLALSRMIRWTAFADRKAARASVDALLARPFERLIVGHGTPVETDAREALQAALAWL